MRLDEITKAEFVDGLKDPAIAELKATNKQIKQELNVEDLRYHLTAFEHPDYGTRRKAYVTWDLSSCPLETIQRRKEIHQYITKRYVHELTNWNVKGWESSATTMEIELVEK